MARLASMEAMQASIAAQAGSVNTGSVLAATGGLENPGGGPRSRATASAAAAAALAAYLKSLSNTETNRYKDNNNNDDLNCKMFPYSEADEKCKGNNAHHAIPDHCWRAGGKLQKMIVNQGKAYREYGDGFFGPLAPLGYLVEVISEDIGTKIDNITPGGTYYHIHENGEPIVDKKNGLAICVTGKGKTLDHGSIHKKIDEAEAALGELGRPKYTTTLAKMQEAAATAISEVTKCDREDLLRQMRAYYGKLFKNAPPESIKLRADPRGQNTSTPGSDPILNDRTGAPTL